MDRPKLSLVIISLNEEANIERCIRSAPFVDETIVLDSGSTDKTVSIASSFGAKTFVEQWRGYRDQKIRATELASYDWILSLDADEALSGDAQAEILEILESGRTGDFDGYEFSRLSYHMGRWIRFGGWFPDWQLRLFNRKKAGWKAGHVHERVQATLKRRLRHPILHWPFSDLAEQVATNNRYSGLGAQDLFDRRKRFSIPRLLLKPASKFLETYVIKRGFLDGLPGFIIAVGAAYSVFLKFAKLSELERKSREMSTKEAAGTQIKN